MKRGRHQQRVLFIAAAAAGLAWATHHGKSEDDELMTLGVIYPPRGGRTRYFNSDGKIGSMGASSLNVDGAEEILAGLIRELRASGHMLDNDAGCCAAATVSRQENFESCISEVNYGSNGQQFREEGGVVDGLNMGMIPPNGIQPTGNLRSVEKGSTKDGKSILDGTDAAEAVAVATIESGSGLGDMSPISLPHLEPGEHNGYETKPAENQLEQQVTNQSPPAASDERTVDFAAHDGPYSTGEIPESLKGGVTVDVDTADMVTTDEDDISINDFAFDDHGMIKTIAGADSHGDNGQTSADDTVDGDLLHFLTPDVPFSETPGSDHSMTDGVGFELHTSIGTEGISEEGMPTAVGDSSGVREREADCRMVRQHPGHETSSADCEQGVFCSVGNCLSDSKVSSECTPEDFEQVLQQVRTYDGSEFERIGEEALKQSPAATYWVASTSEAGVATEDIKKFEGEPIQSGIVVAPIPPVDEVNALHEMPQRPTLADGTPVNDLGNDEMFPPITTNTEAPQIMSYRDGSMGKEVSNMGKEERSAPRKHTVSRIPVEHERGQVGGKARGVWNPLPRADFNDFSDIILPLPPHSIEIDGPMLRGSNSLLEDSLQNMPVVAIGWWRKWGEPSVKVTKGVSQRWAEVVGMKGQALARKILAVIQAWMVAIWQNFIKPRIDRSRLQLEDVARSVFNEVGEHLADAQLAEAL